MKTLVMATGSKHTEHTVLVKEYDFHRQKYFKHFPFSEMVVSIIQIQTS